MAVDSSENLVKKIVETLKDKKGVDIISIDLRKVSGAFTDFFVIATGTSDRHVISLGESILKELKEGNLDRPAHKEGFTAGEWVLLDFFNVIVHVFQKEKRGFYKLEDLWGDGKVKSY